MMSKTIYFNFSVYYPPFSSTKHGKLKGLGEMTQYIVYFKPVIIARSLLIAATTE